MTTAGNVSHIGNIYHQVRSHGDAGRPDDAAQKALPVCPADRVTLSKEALSRYRQGAAESTSLKGEQD